MYTDRCLFVYLPKHLFICLFIYLSPILWWSKQISTNWIGYPVGLIVDFSQTMSGFCYATGVTVQREPVQQDDAATKGYVDTAHRQLGGLQAKPLANGNQDGEVVWTTDGLHVWDNSKSTWMTVPFE